MSKSTEETKGQGPSKHGIKSICVFGGSSLGKDRDFLQAANEIGKILAAKNINLVYGGGILGLRGCVATSAFLGGTKVLGVLLKDIGGKKDPYSTIGSELRVPSLPERMGCMLYNAQAFIALPGGLETLEALSNIIYWAKLNFHKKPLGLLNTNGFYDGLLSFLDHAVEQGFIPQATRHTIITASTADQLISQLQTYVAELNPPLKQTDQQLSDSSKRSKLDTTLRL